MTRRLVARLLLLVLPVLAVGLFSRVYYTPDEPREASLALAMAAHPAALPTLGGVPFAEKPPLLYWFSAAVVAVTGPVPAGVRAPNLLYGLIAALALALIVRRAAGPFAGYLTGAVVVTALQLYDVLIWQATDAPLLAGVAVSLAGTFAAVTTEVPAGRWRAYAVLALGLLMAFYAKGPAGWMVPGFAFATVVVTERRWRDFRRPEPWVVVPIVLAGIAPWIFAVLARADGIAALRTLFWDNLVGRAVDLHGAGALAYAQGHRNSFAKYLIELPVYLLPWTALALVAFAGGLRGPVRQPGAVGTAWRLAYGATLPATVLLSLAVTARGVYFAPPLLGFALMVGLQFGDPLRAARSAGGAALGVSKGLVAALTVAVLVPALALALAPSARDTLHETCAALAVVGAALALRRAFRRHGTVEQALRDLVVAVGLTLVLVAGPLYIELNPLVDLAATAEDVRAATQGRSLRLYRPDETTVAMADLYLGSAATVPEGSVPSDPSVRYLWLVPDRYRWSAWQWLDRLGYRRAGALPIVSPPVVPPSDVPRARVEVLIERPGGRRYALLSLPTEPVP